MNNQQQTTTGYDQRSLFAFLTSTLNAAGDEVNAHANKMGTRHKSDQTLVTEADLASERLIIERVVERYPDDAIYSEESNVTFTARHTGNKVWVIDPLDGTTNFANRYPFYCVSVAVGEVDQQANIKPFAGGIYNPSNKVLYLGYLNGGAYRNGQRMTVATERNFADTLLVCDFRSQDEESLTRLVNNYLRLNRQVSTIRRDGASALDLALVADGIFDGLWLDGVKPWDIAAGCLLVSEAGGVTSNHPSTPFNIEAGNIVAGNSATVVKINSLLG